MHGMSHQGRSDSKLDSTIGNLKFGRQWRKMPFTGYLYGVGENEIELKLMVNESKNLALICDVSRISFFMDDYICPVFGIFVPYPHRLHCFYPV